MKPILTSILLLSAALMVAGNSYSQDDISVLNSPYTMAISGKGGVIYLHDKDGKSNILPNAKGDYLAWSPDGKTFAFRIYHDGGKTWSIHSVNIDGSNLKRLTDAKNKWDSAPAWAPDGKKIAFAREYKNTEGVWQAEIWLMEPDGSKQTKIKALQGSNPYFTPDGRIVFTAEFKDKKGEISIANSDGSNIVHLTDNQAEEWHPEVSPDGKQIAFMSNRDGNFEIYVMNTDGSNQKRLTYSEVDNYFPSWSADGSKILFNEAKEHNIYVINSDGSSEKQFISSGRDAVFKR